MLTSAAGMEPGRFDQEGRGLYGGLPGRRVYRVAWRALIHPAFVHLNAPDDRAAAALDALRRRPLHVELGFGRPHFLREMAVRFPDVHFLGVETRRKWCEQLLDYIDRSGVTNVSVAHGDARALLPALPDGCVQAFYVHFPDPWPKARHHHRRVVSPDSLDLLAAKLEPGGRVVLKTDVPGYVALIDECFGAHPLFAPGDPEVVAALPRSHREKKCIEVRTPYFARIFVRREAPAARSQNGE